MNEGGSIAVVVVVSPSGSVTAIEKPGVVSILNIWSMIGVGLNTGAAFAQTSKSKVVVLVPPNQSVPVKVIVVVPAVVGVPEKVHVTGSYVMPAGVADEVIVKFSKSENTFAGRV